MKIGNYWDETQVAIVDIRINPSQSGGWGFSAPAFAASVLRNDSTIMGVIFVEAIPGSEHYGQFLDPTTRTLNNGNMVRVNIWEGKDVKTMTMKRNDVWPIQWFGLTKLPSWVHPIIAAFDHAMGVVSP